MTELHKILVERFGEKMVSEIPVKEGEIPLLLVKTTSKSPVTVLMTNGLSDYKMPVPDKWKAFEFNELYFCLPGYWQIQDRDNPLMNWVFPWIQRLTKFVLETETWFGHGHTMPCGAEKKSLSLTMKQNHFFLSNPILLEKELEAVNISDRKVHFLAIIPIFKNEMDYKQRKGTIKFLQSLNNKGITEKMDDFRISVKSSKWSLFKK
jgi:hypothetical protein